MPRPVIAAIPNHNMAPYLDTLLPKLLEQEYAEVIVLDDASHDASRDVATKHGALWSPSPEPEATGAGATRNRLLQLQDERTKLWGDAIIHFVDADMEPLTANNPDTARDIFDDKTIAMAGGLIRNRDRTQMATNYGPLITLDAFLCGALQLRNAQKAKGYPHQANRTRHYLKDLLGEWPDTTRPLVPRDTKWVAEGNLLIPSDVLSRTPFGEDRHHDVQGIGIQLDREGKRVRYDPRIAFHHLEGGDHQGSLRLADQLQATSHLIRKFGLVRFITGYDSHRANG